MDRRKLLWLGGLIIGATLGCRRAEMAPDSADPYGSPVPPPASAADSSQNASSPYHSTSSRRSKSEDAPKEPDGKPINLVRIAEVYSESAVNANNPPEQRQKSLQLAKQHFRRATQLDPKLLEAYIGMSRLCAAMGEQEQAVIALDAGLAKLPKDARLWYERGMLLGRQKNHEEAVKSLHQAAQLDPSNKQYSKSVGLMLARMGRADESMPWLKRAMGEADARYNLARMMRHIGSEEEYRRHLALAIQADPRHEGALALRAADRADEAPAPVAPAAAVQSPEGAVRPASFARESTAALPPLRIIVDSPAPTAPAAPAVAPPPANVFVSGTPQMLPQGVAPAQPPIAPQHSLPERPTDSSVRSTPRQSPVMPVVSEQWENRPALPASLAKPAPTRAPTSGPRPAVKLGFDPNG